MGALPPTYIVVRLNMGCHLKHSFGGGMSKKFGTRNFNFWGGLEDPRDWSRACLAGGGSDRPWGREHPPPPPKAVTLSHVNPDQDPSLVKFRCFARQFFCSAQLG